STSPVPTVGLVRAENVTNYCELIRSFGQLSVELIDLAQCVFVASGAQSAASHYPLKPLQANSNHAATHQRQRQYLYCAQQLIQDTQTLFSLNRTVIDRSIILLLSASKASMRHAECEMARANRDSVLVQIRAAVNVILALIKLMIFYDPNSIYITGPNSIVSSRNAGQLAATANNSSDNSGSTNINEIRLLTRLNKLQREQQQQQPHTHGLNSSLVPLASSTSNFKKPAQASYYGINQATPHQPTSVMPTANVDIGLQMLEYFVNGPNGTPTALDAIVELQPESV
ncbi:hypothetical protein GZH46_00772, partial [Fragariocoptes setiger]